jgi:hypothetical protein
MGFEIEFLAEPVGTRVPKFSSDNKSGHFYRMVSQNIDLLCPAQAFPIPHFK